MENFEKEYILSKIVCGYINYSDKGITLRINHPTPDVIYEANKISYEYYLLGKEEEMFDDDDAFSLLVANNEYTAEDEKNLNYVLPKQIEYFQKQLLLNYTSTDNIKKIRKYLSKAREEQSRLYNIRHKYDNFTVEGTASQLKHSYIIENSTYLEGKKFDWSTIGITSVLSYCNQQAITPNQIREISHTMPWANMWQSCKLNGNIFPRSGVELTQAQSLLILWSKMYDNINESPDCPNETIINDDDMLDGWLLLQKEKRDREKTEKGIDEIFSTNEKIKNAQEVYIIANNKEDAEIIDKLNSKKALSIKQSRMQTLKEKGTVRHQEFKDVQQERLIQLNNAYNEHMRSKAK